MTRSILSGYGFLNMFEHNRNLPKVLKCFIYGKKDVAFPQKYLNEKAIYYCYKNKLEAPYH
jgi:hypothetical protein